MPIPRLKNLLVVGQLVWLLVIPMQGLTSDFGGVGLIKNPSARFSPDGTLSTTIAFDEVADLYNISFQATPWLEASFRYAIFDPRTPRARAKDNLRDRSYSAKARVLRERSIIPQIAIGVADILGTGVWEGEYIVASKRTGAFDLSLGLGWGRLGSRGGISNPLGIFGDSFDTRQSGRAAGDLGGNSRGSSFFSGDVGFFGGVKFPRNALNCCWNIVLIPTPARLD
jgi:hypothetical protein